MPDKDGKRERRSEGEGNQVAGRGGERRTRLCVRERKTRRQGRGEKEEGVFSIAAVEREKENGKERQGARWRCKRGIFWDRLPKCRESYKVV